MFVTAVLSFLLKFDMELVEEVWSNSGVHIQVGQELDQNVWRDAVSQAQRWVGLRLTKMLLGLFCKKNTTNALLQINGTSNHQLAKSIKATPSGITVSGYRPHEIGKNLNFAHYLYCACAVNSPPLSPARV